MTAGNTYEAVEGRMAWQQMKLGAGFRVPDTDDSQRE